MHYVYNLRYAVTLRLLPVVTGAVTVEIENKVITRTHAHWFSSVSIKIVHFSMSIYYCFRFLFRFIRCTSVILNAQVYNNTVHSVLNYNYIVNILYIPYNFSREWRKPKTSHKQNVFEKIACILHHSYANMIFHIWIRSEWL